jgi:hypothetical protein
MISKKWMAFIVAIIAVTLFTATILVLVNNFPETPRSLSMILKADDIDVGGHWNQTMSGGDNMMRSNLTSEAYSYMLNESTNLSIGIQVFNNDTNCHLAMPKGEATNDTIGDESVYSYGEDDISYFSITFRESNVLVLIILDPIIGDPQWIYNSAIHIAELQSQKIGQFH